MAPDLPPIPDPDTGTVPFEGFDRALHAILGRATRAVSPTSLLLAYTDWLSHLLLSPAKQAHLVQKALRKAHRLGSYLPGAMSGRAEPCIEPLEQDRRFNHPDWQRWPFNAYYQSFLLVQQWWHNATTEVRGVSRHNEDIVTFAARQLLDIVSPSNLPFTNPEVLRRTLETGGLNLYQGWLNWVEDFERIQAGRPPIGAEAYRPGKTVAVTPGKVVFRNRLIELIQYAPTTAEVRPEPILIVPAWIMKYYILDLSPQNSLVKYLVDSWAHRVLHLVEEPRGVRARSRHGGLPADGDDGCARTPSPRSCRSGRSMPSAIASAGRSPRSERRRWRATTTTGSRRCRSSRPRPTSPSRASSVSSSTSRS